MMKFLKGLVVALALALLPMAAHAAATGNNSYLCAAQLPGQTGPRTIGGSINTGSITGIPSGNLYALNGQGCAVVRASDVGWFLSQGFTYGQNVYETNVTAVTANSTTTNGPVLPAWAYIDAIIVNETAGNAITGGLNIGTAASGAQVVSALTVGANALTYVTDAALLKRVFSTTTSQQLFFSAVTAWNSASINVTIIWSYF